MTSNQTDFHPLSIVAPPRTIGEMVVEDYRKAEVFRKFGLDYCCGGKKSLEESCQKKGLDPRAVQAELDSVNLISADKQEDYDQWDLDALVGHILDRHHQYVAGALPMLYELTIKVARVHGERHPELVEIAGYFDAVAKELQIHMQKEEGILFPYITEMAVANRAELPMPIPAFGTIENPIRMMEAEHESAGNAMAEIRHLSHDFTPPEDACTSYRVLFAKLNEFEQDLHQHVHLENNILFPKAVSLENGVLAA